MEMDFSNETEALLEMAYRVRRCNFEDVIEFDVPDMTKVVRVTSDRCVLDCAHCGGYYLKGMTPISEGLNLEGCTSMLISGGCDEAGRVDMSGHLDFIRAAKDKNIRINAHVGLLARDRIEQMSELADCVSFDFVSDSDTIREVYGLDKTVDDYVRTYSYLRECTRVVPHICIGLHAGRVHGEYDALKRLKELGAECLVFIVFIPTPGTRYEKKSPPHIEDIAKLLATARIEFPDIPIHLGCMRPKGRLRVQTDCIAVKCGVNKIVNPTRSAAELAKQMGLEIKHGRECCVL